MRKLFAVALVAASVMSGGAVSHAAGPTFERIVVDESGPDPDLSAYCGFAVTFTYKGSIILRTFSDRSTGLVELKTLNAVLTLSANGKSYSSRDVGADVLTVSADGTVIITVVGQIPFGFTGAIKVNLVTDEVIVEPHHDLSADLDKACAALAP